MTQDEAMTTLRAFASKYSSGALSGLVDVPAVFFEQLQQFILQSDQRSALIDSLRAAFQTIIKKTHPFLLPEEYRELLADVEKSLCALTTLMPLNVNSRDPISLKPLDADSIATSVGYILNRDSFEKLSQGAWACLPSGALIDVATIFIAGAYYKKNSERISLTAGDFHYLIETNTIFREKLYGEIRENLTYLLNAPSLKPILLQLFSSQKSTHDVIFETIAGNEFDEKIWTVLVDPYHLETTKSLRLAIIAQQLEKQKYDKSTFEHWIEKSPRDLAMVLQSSAQARQQFFSHREMLLSKDFLIKNREWTASLFLLIICDPDKTPDDVKDIFLKAFSTPQEIITFLTRVVTHSLTVNTDENFILFLKNHENNMHWLNILFSARYTETFAFVRHLCLHYPRGLEILCEFVDTHDTMREKLFSDLLAIFDSGDIADDKFLSFSWLMTMAIKHQGAVLDFLCHQYSVKEMITLSPNLFMDLVNAKTQHKESLLPIVLRDHPDAAISILRATKTNILIAPLREAVLDILKKAEFNTPEVVGWKVRWLIYVFPPEMIHVFLLSITKLNNPESNQDLKEALLTQDVACKTYFQKTVENCVSEFASAATALHGFREKRKEDMSQEFYQMAHVQTMTDCLSALIALYEYYEKNIARFASNRFHQTEAGLLLQTLRELKACVDAMFAPEEKRTPFFRELPGKICALSERAVKPPIDILKPGLMALLPLVTEVALLDIAPPTKGANTQ